MKAQPKPATGDATEETRSYDTLLDEAVGAFDASDFARAHDLFQQAYALRPNARVLRGVGIAALRLGHYSEAYRTLSAALKHPVLPLTASQRDEVTGLLSWMETNLASVRLHFIPAEPADYELLVDGEGLRGPKESTLWLTPGTHHIALHTPGFGAVERAMTLAAEQHDVIDFTLRPRKHVATAAHPSPAVNPTAAALSLSSAQTSQPTHQKVKPKLTAISPQSNEARAKHGSVWTRWWFWTALGAVAAGSVTAAVLLSRPAGTLPPDTSGGAQRVELPAAWVPP